MERAPRYPLLHALVGNALLLSAMYLALGLALEILLRFYPMHWAEEASAALDSLPARTLQLVGALAPLSRAFAYGQLSAFWVRIIFGATTVAVIFIVALSVGLVMLGLTAATRRRA